MQSATGTVKVISTRWVTPPVWLASASSETDAQSGRTPPFLQPARGDVAQLEAPEVKKVRQLLDGHLLMDNKRKVIQKILMLDEAGVPLTKELLDLCTSFTRRLPEKEVHKMRAVAKTWVRRVSTEAARNIVTRHGAHRGSNP